MVEKRRAEGGQYGDDDDLSVGAWVVECNRAELGLPLSSGSRCAVGCSAGRQPEASKKAQVLLHWPQTHTFYCEVGVHEPVYLENYKIRARGKRSKQASKQTGRQASH